MKFMLICFFIVVVVQNDVLGLSEKQFQALVKLVKNVCQPKHKATNEQIAAMHAGDWNQDKNGQCYMFCILNYFKLMRKDNSFDWEGGVKAIITTAPERLHVSASKSIENCKDAVKTFTDKCTAAFEVSKCVYDDNPAEYFLP